MAAENTTTTSWGSLSWLAGSTIDPGSEQCMGIAAIKPGMRNPLHRHPNCEELMYVLEGTCRKTIGDGEVDLKPGDLVRIPRNVPHRAECTSAEPLRAVVIFSSPERQSEVLEPGGEIA